MQSGLGPAGTADREHPRPGADRHTTRWGNRGECRARVSTFYVVNTHTHAW